MLRGDLLTFALGVQKPGCREHRTRCWADGRKSGNYPETGFWEITSPWSPRVEPFRVLGSLGRILDYSQKCHGLREIGGYSPSPFRHPTMFSATCMKTA